MLTVLLFASRAWHAELVGNSSYILLEQRRKNSVSGTENIERTLHYRAKVTRSKRLEVAIPQTRAVDLRLHEHASATMRQGLLDVAYQAVDLLKLHQHHLEQVI